NADDVSGIQVIYSAGAARSPDIFGAGLGNHQWYTPASITSYINPVTLTGQVPNMDVTSAGETDWYLLTVPAGTNGIMQLQVQSTGQSMLQPVISAYPNGTFVGTNSGAGQLGGTTVPLNVGGMYAGELVYVSVSGANNS